MSDRQAPSLAERIAGLSAAKRALLLQKRPSLGGTGYDRIAEALREAGISHVYGVAGRPTEEILPACYRRGIRPIGVYHQSSAVCMALAHNYQAGRLAAATVVSAGPAVTNAMTGLLVARDNGWPVLVFGGRRSLFQQCDALPFVSHVVKCAMDVPTAGAIGDCVRQAARIAMSGRPGPVYLEIHEDVLASQSANGHHSAGTCPDAVDTAPVVSVAQIEEVAASLISANRPALIVGKGVRWTVPPAQLRELVEIVGIPFITSPMGRGFLADDHPLCANQARTALQFQADAVLILGARLNWVFRHGAALSPAARVWRVDIERDAGIDPQVSAARGELIHTDAGEFVARLLVALRHRLAATAEPVRQQRLARWHDELRAASNETLRALDACMAGSDLPMSPYRMMKEVRDALPRDAVCITEGNVSMLAAQAVIPGYTPASRMDAGTNACMGVGIPFAIGAKLACPDRPVVAIVGDYGFSLSAMEMEVCVRHRIPIVVLVANNQGNNGALKHKAYFPEPDAELVTMFQPQIEYDRIMRLFGGRGTTIRDPGALRPAIEEAIASGTPTCINVDIDPDTPLPAAWGKIVNTVETTA